MRQPSTVDLTTQKHSFWLDHSSKVILFLGDSIVDADVGAIPVTFFDVDNGINIVLVGFDAEVPPQLA